MDKKQYKFLIASLVSVAKNENIARLIDTKLILATLIVITNCVLSIMFENSLSSINYCLLILSEIFLIMVIIPRKYYDPVHWDTMYSEENLNKDHIEYVNQIIADQKECYDRNSRLLLFKTRFFLMGFIIFMINFFYMLILV